MLTPSLRLPKSVLLALYGLLCLALISALPMPGRSQALTPLHSFDSYGDGSNPIATMTLASDGNFYGTTDTGGQFGYGTVYQLTPAGAITTIHSFNGGDGNSPYGKLIQATDGNLYGTTRYGGLGYGTVYKMTLAGVVTNTYQFTAGNDGYYPYGGVIQATDGSLYGTTSLGGKAPTGGYATGTIFKLTVGATPVLTTLYTFTAASNNLYSNGYSPEASLLQASDGSLYGTTTAGGVSSSANRYGTVFRLKLGATPVLTTLHVFAHTVTTDGASPGYGALIQASDGNLYGTTQAGGTQGLGTVFKVGNLSGTATYTTLYGFVYDPNTGIYVNGYNPLAGLVQGQDGALYGTSVSGGTPSAGGSASGAIFRITTAGAITPLGSFTSDAGGNYSSGQNPYAGLALYTDGTLYGTAYTGGPPRNLGTVFKVTTGGAFTLLDSFTNGFVDGKTPQSKVIQASDGYFYGTTSVGGVYGQGIVYRSDGSGGYVILHSFSSGAGEGYTPYGGLVEASDGNLYGTTVSGGSNGAGTVYKITKAGAFSTLYNFGISTTDGANPYGDLIQAADGSLYGTTYNGGQAPSGRSAGGTIFRVTLGGNLTTLYTFLSNSGGGVYPNGSSPQAGLLQASDGNLYGTTVYGGSIGATNYSVGTVFQLTLGATPTLTTLHVFTSNPDGAYPYYGSLVQAGDGKLYGTTQSGGTYGQGTVYRLALDGSGYKTLRSFSGSDGQYPYGGLVVATDGSLYGTTSSGGDNATGNVFRLTTGGLLTSLYPFSALVSTGGPVTTNADGASPQSSLIQGANGNLYGTATAGGTAGYGTLFTINVQVPTVTGFSPTSGGPGATVTISGTGFTGATAVKFNNTPATTFTVLSPTQLTAVVPAGATTGKIRVSAPTGIATSVAVFTVLSTPAPAITGFSPASGPVGTLVQISGSGFNTATGVSFGGVSAAFSANSDTQLVAVVPSGAATGPISISGPGGTGLSTAAFTVTASATPTVTGFTPAGGPVGTLVQIGGTNFTSVSDVTFGGVEASFTVNSESQITAVVPSGAATGPISVTTPDGTGTSAASFTVGATGPAISGFTPTTGPVGTLVQISGSGFTGATRLKFRTTAAHFTVGSDTKITATVPSGAVTGPLVVTTPGGTAVSPAFFTVPGTTIPVPAITGFTPTSGTAGTVVTLTGSGFYGASAVSFNGTPATTYTVVNDGQITATVPSGATTGPVSVMTPGGTGTSAGSFTVSTPPAITGFTPASGPVGTSVTLTGTGFTGATAVAIGGTAATFSVASDTQITATVAAGTTSGTITVTAPAGTATSGTAFTVTAAAPTISGFTPTSGPVGTGVTVTGTGFTGASSVAFGGTAATSFTVVSDTQVTAAVPAGATTGAVTLTTPSGTATGGTFTVTAAAPTISGFTPASGPVGTSVIITGTNLTGATAVAFNGTGATSFTVNSATQITATVAVGTTSGAITVTTPGGTATSGTPFTVTAPAPTITGFTPASGPVGTSVTLTGTGFTGATAVSFGGTAATSFTVNSPTQITATVPTGATTGTITVTTPGGTGTSGTSFTVTTASGPTVTGFTPNHGATGASVVLTGTGFTGATAVSFGGTAATFTVNSATQITAKVPASAVTGPLSVTAPGGTGSSTALFYATPTLTGFTPTSGAVGATVTLTGTNFTGATSIKFGTVATTAFTVVSNTQITVAVPAKATSGTIQVTTPAGTAASSASFTVAPILYSFTPSHGPVGTSVTISGVNFTGATSVTFNGTTAAFTVVSATQITTTVPAGATAGKIAVTSPAGTGLSTSTFSVP